MFARILAILVALGVSSSLAHAAVSQMGVHRNVDASHCEAFVERAALVFGNGQRVELRVFLKAHPHMLDDAVVEVGFHALKRDPGRVCSGAFRRSNPQCANVDVWSDYRGRPFFYGSKDYFEVRFDVSNIEGDFFSYEGVFYVQTEMGTRYWIHPSEQINHFFFEEQFVDQMMEDQCAFDQRDFDHSLIFMSDELTSLLNSNFCR